MRRVAWVLAGLIAVVGGSSACGPDASVSPTATAGTAPPTAASTTSSTQGIVPSSTTTAAVTSTTSTTLPTYADARVVPAEASSRTTEEPLPFPEVALEPVGQGEIDAGLGDLVRRLAWEEETARPTWQMAYWGEIRDIKVIGRVAGILLFETRASASTLMTERSTSRCAMGPMAYGRCPWAPLPAAAKARLPSSS